MKNYERRSTFEERSFRFTNFIDAESMAFEAEAQSLLSGAATEQTLFYLQHAHRNFYLLQVRGPDQKPTLQACIYVGQSQIIPGFNMATIPNLHTPKDGIEEEIGLKILKKICSEIPGAMTLRVQPIRFNPLDLINFQSRALRQGFHITNPLGTVRTLLLDLFETEEEFLAQLPQKTRAKFRNAGWNRVTLLPLTDPAFIPACRKATNASHVRSDAKYDTSFDFDGVFALAKARPDQAQIIGLFLNDRPNHNPENLLAYVIGLRNGTRAEYASAGSLQDPELRSLPFNYFLLSELTRWARHHGCRKMDLCGITDGDPTDPMSGISRFKRTLGKGELEVGREVVTILRPIRYLVYRFLKQGFKLNLTGLIANYD